MEFVLDPPHGVGPLRLGMTAEQARAALETLGPLSATAYGELALHRASGLGFSVGFGVGPTRDRVNAIEIWRPREDDVVLFRDVDVFGLPALEVAARIGRHLEILPQDDGFASRDPYLALWRPFAADDDPDETEGYFFQSVLIARPGYDDTPAEAEARLAAGGEPGY
ncbi:hypothetical protein FB565_007431 [Actinoplanes lutulentus]|uniref:Uncharacterized protein n=1 Tax=Actinoplanes lutulentus TaxID=1287878 RepID=A0A327Z0B2_9ACTN|nr:hypothetical protein [Actinoplanes lutulentus]MBB2947660.1 hypothetical protein [Actinoplanes lutulentus]RAK27716.1 hypothetical protein B0I29_12299 [Actinoplanes lutulentus]